MTRPYDRILLSQGVCREPKVRRLADDEFRAYIAALCLAGASPVRGHLLVSERQHVTFADLADEARVTVEAAESMVRKMREAGALDVDRRRRCLFFPNWGRYNPKPRPSETRDAWRERKRRQRERVISTKTKLGRTANEITPQPKKRKPYVPPSSQAAADGWEDLQAKIQSAVTPAQFAHLRSLEARTISETHVDFVCDDGDLNWIVKRYTTLLEELCKPAKVTVRSRTR